VTSRQGMLTLLGTWATSGVSRGPCKPDITVSMDCSIYLICTLILTANFFRWLPICFRLPDLTVGSSFYLILTQWHWFWLMVFALEIGSQWVRLVNTPSMHLIPPPVCLPFSQICIFCGTYEINDCSLFMLLHTTDTFMFPYGKVRGV
jgi:hypothetical protein